MSRAAPGHFGLKRVRSFSRKFVEFVAVLLFPGHEFSRIKFSTVSERVKGPHELTPTCNCSRQSGVRQIFVAWPTSHGRDARATKAFGHFWLTCVFFGITLRRMASEAWSVELGELVSMRATR